MVDVKAFKSLSEPAAAEAEKLHTAGLSLPAIFQIIMLVIKMIRSLQPSGEVQQQSLFGGGRIRDMFEFMKAISELLGDIDFDTILPFIEKLVDLFGGLTDSE